MANKIFVSLTVIFLIGLMASCSSDDNISNKEEVKIVLDTRARATADDLQDFYVNFTADALEMTGISKDSDTKNVVVSPLSAAMALAMAANGVDEGLKSQILRYLGVDDIESLNYLMSILMRSLPDLDNLTDVRVANSLWIDSGLKLDNDFSKTLLNHYSAETIALDFSGNSNHNLNSLNSWCSSHTSGLIPAMFDEVKTETLAILMNALSFNGLWNTKNEFLPENTKRDTFHGMSGDSEVDMMCGSERDHQYYLDDKYESFVMSFGNNSFYLVFIIPVGAYQEDKSYPMITSDDYHEIMNNLVNVKLSVTMPKFKLGGKTNVNDILADNIPDLNGSVALNMFDPVLTGGLEINQATALEINEDGMKAAAVTSGEIIYGAPEIVPGNSYSVRVDRPFYFFLTEFTTRAVLLSGRVSDL